MGTDITEVYRGPCPCGSSVVTVERCEPDHPWPTKSITYRTKIACGECSRSFDVIEQEGHYVLVRCSDLALRRQLRNEWHRACDEVMSGAVAQELLRDLARLLDEQPSIAACHRLLESAKLVRDSLSTFRRKWSDCSQWTEANVSAQDLGRISALLDRENPDLRRELDRIENQWSKSSRPCPVVGAPLFSIV